MREGCSKRWSMPFSWPFGAPFKTPRIYTWWWTLWKGESFSVYCASRRLVISIVLHTSTDLFPYRICQLTAQKAFPKSCRQILCSRSHAGSWLPTFNAYYLPRSQAGKLVTGSTWPFKNYRLWLRQGGSRYYLDTMWDARLSCARGRSIERVQQISWLVRPNSLRCHTIIDNMVQVVSWNTNIRNALRLHAFLGWWFALKNLREYNERKSQVPSLYSSRCARPATETHYSGSHKTVRKPSRRIERRYEPRVVCWSHLG